MGVETPLPDPPSAAAEPRRRPSPLAELFNVLRFYSRLPLPRLSGSAEDYAMPDFERSAWAVALGGSMIAAFGAAMGAGGLLIGLSPLICAALSIATIVIITGCFHEDGLADACDGLWGGWSVEKRLEIMKDSRIGSYGAAALILSLTLRIAALSELFRLLGAAAALLLIGMGGLTRVLALVPTTLLPPARQSGLAWQALNSRPVALMVALILALFILGAALLPLGLLAALPVAIAVCAMLMALLIRIMRVKIGGFTGDTLGASQQVFEIALLLVLSAAAARHGPL